MPIFILAAVQELARGEVWGKMTDDPRIKEA